MEPRERLIFALDTDDAARALDLVAALREEVGWFKIGLQLFTAQGPDLVRRVRELGGRVFLDLKFHDIPATVRGGLKAAAAVGAEMVTVHVQAGRAWQEAVSVTGLKVLGVTVLTSLSAADLAELGHGRVEPSALAAQRAELARRAGLAGVVCAGPDVALVRGRLGPGRLIVCPGIRPAWSLVAGDDQARVTTPGRALAAGADMIVVGRPIRDAQDPAEAARRVAAELAQG